MKKLMRSRKNRMLAGVCGGLVAYFSIDPTVVRLIVVLLTIVTALLPVLLCYLLAVAIIPNEGYVF